MGRTKVAMAFCLGFAAQGCAADAARRCDDGGTFVAHPTEYGVQVFAAGILGCVDSVDAVVDYLAESEFVGIEAPLAFERIDTADLVQDAETFFVRARQVIDGTPVHATGLSVQLDAISMEVISVSGQVVHPPRDSNIAPLPAKEALSRAFDEAGIEPTLLRGEPELVYTGDIHGDAVLTWRQGVEHEADGDRRVEEIFADASDGALVDRQSDLRNALNRRIYDAHERTSTRTFGVLFSEGRETSDPVAQEAYDYAGLAYEYFDAVHGRDSYNGRGGRINVAVHYGKNLNHASFDSEFGIIVGDGGGCDPHGQLVLSGSYCFVDYADPDVIAHEFAHGVTKHTADLVYQGQSGAIDEALADIFGAAASYHQGSDRVWDFGETIVLTIYFDSSFDGGYTRSYSPLRSLLYVEYGHLAGRGPFGGRDLYSERYTGRGDYGGVHDNAGIVTVALALLVDGGTHPQEKTSVEVPALGMEKAEAIFYRALTGYLGPRSNFEALRYATAQAAADLYGPAEFDAVNLAWDAVGVPGEYTICSTATRAPTPPPESDGCSAYSACNTCTRGGDCGWCGDRCVEGSPDGPTSGQCAAWAYVGAECTAENSAQVSGEPTPTPADTASFADAPVECYVRRPASAPRAGGGCSTAQSGHTTWPLMAMLIGDRLRPRNHRQSRKSCRRSRRLTSRPE